MSVAGYDVFLSDGEDEPGAEIRQICEAGVAKILRKHNAKEVGRNEFILHREGKGRLYVVNVQYRPEAA